jgi:hypothetical protein
MLKKWCNSTKIIKFDSITAKNATSNFDFARCIRGAKRRNGTGYKKANMASLKQVKS